jgi:hypothetical protein
MINIILFKIFHIMLLIIIFNYLSQMGYKKFLTILKQNLEYYFLWRYNKREYKHLLNLLKNKKRELIFNKKIIFNTVRSNKNILDRELFIAKLLAIHGARVIILLDNGVLKHWDTIKVDRIRSNRNIKRINYNLFPIVHRDIKNIFNIFLAKINLKRALTAYKDENLRVIYYSEIIKKLNITNIKKLEKYAVSSTIRFFKNSEIDFNTPDVKYYFKLSLANSLISRAVGKFILKNLNPDIFVTSHGIYSTWGPTFDYLKKKEVISYVYAGKHSHTNDVRDFYFTDSKVQTLSSSRLWREYKDFELSPSMEKKVKILFDARMSHSTKDTKIYYNKVSQEFKVNKDDGYKYHIAIFPNLIWDGNIEDRHIAFDGIIDWLIKTINYLKNRTDIQIYIKFHPAEITLFSGTPKIQDLLQKKLDLGEFKNLILIGSDDRVDPYQFLRSGIDFAIIYDGILGLEIPYLKIPTLLGGVGGRFSVEGGNYTIKTEKDYFTYLDDIAKHISEFHENYDKYYENIMKYSYWYFFGNVIKLPTLSRKSIYKTDLLQLSKKDLILDKKIIKIFMD